MQSQPTQIQKSDVQKTELVEKKEAPKTLPPKSTMRIIKDKILSMPALFISTAGLSAAITYNYCKHAFYKEGVQKAMDAANAAINSNADKKDIKITYPGNNYFNYAFKGLFGLAATLSVVSTLSDIHKDDAEKDKLKAEAKLALAKYQGLENFKDAKKKADAKIKALEAKISMLHSKLDNLEEKTENNARLQKSAPAA